MAETLQQLAYDEALRTIDAQGTVLDNLRGRAGTLIAVASLVTSFLGGQALAKPTLADGVVLRQDLGAAGVGAIAMFVLMAAMAVAILWPYKWRFDISATAILGWSNGDHGEDLAELARVHDANHTSNAAILDRLFWCFRLGCVFLAAETLLWIIELAN